MYSLYSRETDAEIKQMDWNLWMNHFQGIEALVYAQEKGRVSKMPWRLKMQRNVSWWQCPSVNGEFVENVLCDNVGISPFMQGFCEVLLHTQQGH